MSNNIYIISDTHFGHKLAAKERGFDSLKDHDDYIVDQWNSVVDKKDTVWHLGDVAFGKDALARMNDCNGVKKLVSGNHDKYATEEYLKYFNRVFGIVRFKSVVLSHAPVHPNELEYRWEYNVHGHIHHKEKLIDDSRYFCVNVDIVGFKPILFQSVTDILIK